MAYILLVYFLEWKFIILVFFSLEFIPDGLNDKPAVVQVRAWCKTGDKPSP